MFVETIAGSLEVILGYFIIVPLIVKLVSSVIAVASTSTSDIEIYSDIETMKSQTTLTRLIILRFLGCSLATINYQLITRIYSVGNS